VWHDQKHDRFCQRSCCWDFFSAWLDSMRLLTVVDTFIGVKTSEPLCPPKGFNALFLPEASTTLLQELQFSRCKLPPIATSLSCYSYPAVVQLPDVAWELQRGRVKPLGAATWEALKAAIRDAGPPLHKQVSSVCHFCVWKRGQHLHPFFLELVAGRGEGFNLRTSAFVIKRKAMTRRSGTTLLPTDLGCDPCPCFGL
jgi:hypothetical protein